MLTVFTVPYLTFLALVHPVGKFVPLAAFIAFPLPPTPTPTSCVTTNLVPFFLECAFVFLKCSTMLVPDTQHSDLMLQTDQHGRTLVRTCHHTRGYTITPAFPP